MQEKIEKSWQERASRLFCLLVLTVAAYFLLSISLRLLLPFLLSALLAAVIRPGAALLERKCHVPAKVGSVVLLLILLALLAFGIVSGCNRLLSELQRLLASLTENPDGVGRFLEEFQDILHNFTSHIPLLARLRPRDGLNAFWQQLDLKAAELLTETLNRISAKIPEFIGKIAQSIPSGLFFLVTFLISSFYFCADGPRVFASLVRYLPPSFQKHIPEGKRQLCRVALRYLRAYALLFLLTFAELFLGFTFLGLSYTFLPALLIALVDFLPVLGVGTVLIPWGLIELLRGNVSVGTGLLILYGVILLLRQFEEPRIVGNSLGLHPLLSLFAVYVGLRVGGIGGMLIAPVAALMIKALLTRWQENAQARADVPAGTTAAENGKFKIPDPPRREDRT